MCVNEFFVFLSEFSELGKAMQPVSPQISIIKETHLKRKYSELLV